MDGGAENGAHLGAEHDWFGETQADAGKTERGVEAAVGGGILTEPAGVFVHAQIDGADGDAFAFHFFHNRAVHFVLLVFRRHGVAVEIEEFAVEKSDAVCAEVVQGFDVFGGFDVGEQLDVDTVGGGDSVLITAARMAASSALVIQGLNSYLDSSAEDRKSVV